MSEPDWLTGEVFVVVVPQTGMALCFVHSVHHKGESVFQGRKYVLRTDVMYAPEKRRRKRRPWYR